mmetsp:Transcript_38760/g.83507  ORF Transcript_38760/g.83507 Transcript_38760/m.83507 type:complete len:222 (-) Transcript_38760:2401-3066(-)
MPQSSVRHTTEKVRNRRRNLRLRLLGPDDPLRLAKIRLMTLFRSWTRESFLRSPFASCFARKCNSPTSSEIGFALFDNVSRCATVDGTAKKLIFLGLALDCMILSSVLKALIRGTKEGKTSAFADCPSAPGDKDSAACMGGMKCFNSVSNLGFFIFTHELLVFGTNAAIEIKNLKRVWDVSSMSLSDFRNIVIAPRKISTPAFFFSSDLENRNHPHDHKDW